MLATRTWSGAFVTRLRPVAVIVVTVGVLASCTVPWRESIDLSNGLHVSLDGARLEVEVPTCNGDPEVATLEETATEVRVEVVSRRLLGNAKDCLDVVVVELDQPLGDRDLIDVTSGRTLRVKQP